jgi:hypothetical protein
VILRCVVRWYLRKEADRADQRALFTLTNNDSPQKAIALWDASHTYRQAATTLKLTSTREGVR